MSNDIVNVELEDYVGDVLRDRQMTGKRALSPMLSRDSKRRENLRNSLTSKIQYVCL